MSRSIGGIGAALILVLSLFVWLYSRSFPTLPDGHPGPALFPRGIAIGLFLAGSYLAFRAVTHKADVQAIPLEEVSPESRSGGTARIATLVLAVALYPLLSNLLGFVATVSSTSFLVALLLKARPIPSAATAVGGTLLVYLLFTRVLGVPL